MRPTTKPPRSAARLARAAFAAAALAVLFAPPVAAGSGSASDGEGWSAEFDAVCGKTQDAMTLTVDDLRALVRRCDELKPKIDALDESRRKVYGGRLQACRKLYAFMLGSREAEGAR